MTADLINKIFVDKRAKLFMIFNEYLQKYVIENAEFLVKIVKRNLEADDVLRETNIHISESEFLSCMRVYQEDNADVYSKKYGEEDK